MLPLFASKTAKDLGAISFSVKFYVKVFFAHSVDGLKYGDADLLWLLPFLLTSALFVSSHFPCLRLNSKAGSWWGKAVFLMYICIMRGRLDPGDCMSNNIIVAPSSFNPQLCKHFRTSLLNS